MSVRGRAALTVTAVLALATVGAAFANRSPLGQPRHSEGAADPNLVVVSPVSVSEGDQHLSDVALALTDLIALRTAESLGAGILVRAEAHGTIEDLALTGAMIEEPGGRVLAETSVRGHADSMSSLVDRFVARLLAMRTARDEDELEAFLATSPAALRAYLEGLEAMRRDEFGPAAEATRHFERALFLDSTFALAGLRVAGIASRSGTEELDGLWKFDAIWRARHRLGRADRAVLVAYLGPRYPRPPTPAERIVAARRAAELAPNRAEAWNLAGENLLRFGSMVGDRHWHEQADAALRQAHALDPADASTLRQLFLLSALAGDIASVREYAALHASRDDADRPAHASHFVPWLAAILIEDRASQERIRSGFPAMPRRDLRPIIDWSQALGVGLDDAEQAVDLFVEHASSARDGRAVLRAVVPWLLNRGRPQAAERLLASVDRGFGARADVGLLEFRVHAASYWDGDPKAAAAAVRALEAFFAGAPVRSGDVRDPRTASCALAHWRIALEDHRGAELELRRLRRLAAESDRGPIELTSFCVAAIEAQLAATAGEQGANAALARLDSLLDAGADPQLLQPNLAGVIATRLHEARGNLRRALDLSRRRAFWWNHLLSTQLRDEGRLAARLGDDAGAIRAYRHYLALQSDPEPALRPDVEHVRAELERLERSRPPVQ